MIQQGKEGDKFWEMFFQNSNRAYQDNLYGKVVEWDRLIIDLS